jgi:UDP-2,4-diacetamido-2,4,6-trideoxy-beta-L-altropyranose hydrolase
MFRNLIVRADATKRMGTGHVMRCLAIGQEWKKCGGEVIFFSYLENVSLRDRITSEGFRLISMDRKHPDPSDLRQVLDFLRNDRKVDAISWLVLDGYHFDPDYQASVREDGIRLLVIDDYNHLPRYHADVLLNQNIGAEKISYMTDPDTICLFGPKYALLRNEFIDQKDRIKGQSQPVSNILVTMGGADPDNITLKVFRALLQAGLKGFELNIVAGHANPNLEKLDHEIENAAKAKIATAKRLHLHKNANMPKLIAEADFAITAGGSTCWELCFFGVPFMVIVAAENQRNVARELDRAGASVSLGWHEDVKAANLISAANKLIYDTKKLRSMSLIGRRIVDGQGCERILTLMNWFDTAIDRNDIQLRKASEEDALQLWKLANEKEVRGNSFSPDPISYDEHVKWFREKLESKSSVIYILNVSGVLLAQVRYDRKDNAAEIDYAVTPGSRGKNLGTNILMMTWEIACR